MLLMTAPHIGLSHAGRQPGTAGAAGRGSGRPPGPPGPDLIARGADDIEYQLRDAESQRRHEYSDTSSQYAGRNQLIYQVQQLLR